MITRQDFLFPRKKQTKNRPIRNRLGDFFCLQYRKRQEVACNKRVTLIVPDGIAVYQCRKRQEIACNPAAWKPCSTRLQNGVLVNPDRFLPFSAFPNMYIVSIFLKKPVPTVAVQGISMSTPKSVNPRRSYAGLRGLLWVVLFLIILLYMAPLFFARENLSRPVRLASFRCMNLLVLREKDLFTQKIFRK